MGTSVATELMARDLEGRLGFELAGVLLFNGSIVLERASPTPAQKLLRSPLGPLAARLSSERVFRHQFGSVFSAAHPLSDEEAADQWSLVCHGGGRTLGHRLIAYMDERIEHADRWHGAIRDWPRLQLAWGLLDPVATVAVLDALRELHPGVPVTELPDLGHYPQLEDPGRMAGIVGDAAARDGCRLLNSPLRQTRWSAACSRTRAFSSIVSAPGWPSPGHGASSSRIRAFVRARTA